MIILAETKPATVTFTLRFNVVSKNFSHNYRDSFFTCRGHKLESNLFTSLSELKKNPEIEACPLGKEGLSFRPVSNVVLLPC